MADIYNQTVKGIYNYPQINNFISVRNYMFIWKNGKKCLLLRFFNGFSQEINELEYTVTQLDINKNVIKQSDISINEVCIIPGNVYATDMALAVEEACVDFKLSFKKVRSGIYEYRVFDDIIEVFYPSPEKKLFDSDDLPMAKKTVTSFSERSREIGNQGRGVRVATVTLLLIILFNAFQMVYPYIKFSVIKEWINDKIHSNSDNQTDTQPNVDYYLPETDRSDG